MMLCSKAPHDPMFRDSSKAVCSDNSQAWAVTLLQADEQALRSCMRSCMQLTWKAVIVVSMTSMLKPAV